MESQPAVEEKKTVEKLPFVTYREYFDDSYKVPNFKTPNQFYVQCVSTGRVLSQWNTEKENEKAVVLDKTIFHPQGGGQPSDEGFITSQDGTVKFIVKALQSKDDAILHLGAYEKEGDKFEDGQEVILNVDEEKRRLFARYHSAGHLLDIAMKRCGQTQLKPGKGYHFTVGAYVEYLGNVDNAIKDKLVSELNKAANDIIKEQNEANGVFSRLLPYEEGKKILGEVPPYIPKDQDFRVVKLTEEDDGCPCGGTHVKNVLDINEIEVTKIIKKGKNTRVSYIVK